MQWENWKGRSSQIEEKKLGLEQSVPLIHTFEALHNFSGKGIWLSRRSIVWLWKESFVKRKLCFWKFLFEPHQPQKNILISLICFHRGATTWSPAFFQLDDKTERRWANVYKSGHPIIFYSPNTQQIVLCLDVTIFIQQLRQKDKEKYLSSYYHPKYLRFDSSHIPSSQAQ